MTCASEGGPSHQACSRKMSKNRWGFDASCRYDNVFCSSKWSSETLFVGKAALAEISAAIGAAHAAGSGTAKRHSAVWAGNCGGTISSAQPGLSVPGAWYRLDAEIDRVET